MTLDHPFPFVGYSRLKFLLNLHPEREHRVGSSVFNACIFITFRALLCISKEGLMSSDNQELQPFRYWPHIVLLTFLAAFRKTESPSVKLILFLKIHLASSLHPPIRTPETYLTDIQTWLPTSHWIQEVHLNIMPFFVWLTQKQLVSNLQPSNLDLCLGHQVRVKCRLPQHPNLPLYFPHLSPIVQHQELFTSIVSIPVCTFLLSSLLYEVNQFTFCC